MIKKPIRGIKFPGLVGTYIIPQNCVTPQMFGAVGDGVADDTQAVKSAIASGSSVFFPKGTYLITESISIDAPVHMFGAGVKRTKIVYGGTDFLFRVLTEFTNYTIIEKMSFESERNDATQSFILCTSQTESWGWGGSFALRDFHVHGFNDLWMRLVSAFKVTIENGTISSNGKCVTTTWDNMLRNTNFNNCISFHNVYIGKFDKDGPRIPVMFELFNVKQLQFTECALEQCDVVFKDYMTDEYLASADYNPNGKVIDGLNLDRCWFEYIGAMYDFQYNSDKPIVTAPLYAHIAKYNANLARGEIDRMPGDRHNYYRNGETSSVEEAIYGSEVVYSNAIITNESDESGTNFYPYKISSNHAEFNVPLNVKTIMSTDNRSVSFDLRSIVRWSFASSSFKIKIFVMYDVNELNIWELEYFGHNKRYYRTKCEKVFTKGTGSAVTATETISDNLTNGGNPVFTTDKDTVRLGMVVEYNLNGITKL